MFLICIFLLLVMAYSKTTSNEYSLNTAIKNRLTLTGAHGFLRIQSQNDWYNWVQRDLLESLETFDRLNPGRKSLVR